MNHLILLGRAAMTDKNREFVDSREAFTAEEEAAYRCCPDCLMDHDECECGEDGDYDGYDEWLDETDYDGQPDEWTEWQDVYGGDDWDHGQYDDCDW